MSTVIAAATYVIVVGFVLDRWVTVLTFVGTIVLLNLLLRPLFARPDLSTERLTDLVTPQLIDVDTAHPSVAFGDPKEQAPTDRQLTLRNGPLPKGGA